MVQLFKFLARRFVVNLINMVESNRPKLLSPIVCELLGLRLARKLASQSRRLRRHDLQMAQLMQKHVIEHEAAHRDLWPLPAANRPKRFNRAVCHTAR